MNPLKLLTRLDKKYAFGLFTGLMFGLLSVYTDFFRSSEPGLSFDMLTNTSVLDIHEDIGNLRVIYHNQDIRTSKQQLRILTFKVLNSGDLDLRKADFDSEFPIGFQISQGRIAETPQLIESSSDYLSKSVKTTVDTVDKAHFSDPILEVGEFFVLKVLVLADEGDAPDIIPLGKIAGLKEIKVIRSFLEIEERTFWQRLTEGTILIHISRFFFYFFVLGGSILALMLPFAAVSTIIQSRRRSRMIRNFKGLYKGELTSDASLIFEMYQSRGGDFLKRLVKDLSNPVSLDMNLRLEDASNRLEDSDILKVHEQRLSSEIVDPFVLRKTITMFKENGLIKESRDGLSVDETFKSILTDFSKFVNA